MRHEAWRPLRHLWTSFLCQSVELQRKACAVQTGVSSPVMDAKQNGGWLPVDCKLITEVTKHAYVRTMPVSAENGVP